LDSAPMLFILNTCSTVLTLNQTRSMMIVERRWSVREGKKIITRSICFDLEVYAAMEAETVKLGYGSQSRLVNHAMRKLLKIKPKPNSYQRENAK